MAEFGVLNWTIVIVVFTVFLAMGYFISRNVSTAEDFYKGHSAIPWWVIGVSVVAAYVSAMTFLGAPAWAYKAGMSVIIIHINYPIVIFVVVTFFFPFFYNSGVISIYDYLEKRFGSASRLTISGVFLVTQALSSAAVLYGTSLVISFITGISVIPCIFIVTLIALTYTIMGGIAAIIWIELVQAVIFVSGAGIIMYTLLTKLPLPLAETIAELKTMGKINPLKWGLDFSDATSVWAGVVAMTLYHITVCGTNQMMVQRTLTARSIGDAKKSFLIIGFAGFFIYFLFVSLGTLFYHYYDGKQFENDNMIILQFAANYGLPGLMGIVAAAIMSASMSSLASAYNSLSTVTLVDFYQKFVSTPQTPAYNLRLSRIFTASWGLFIIIPAIMYSTLANNSILELLTKIGSFFVAAKLSMFGLGFFSKHTTQKGLLVGVVAGLLVVWVVAITTSISWPWYCLIGTIVNVGVAIPLSILWTGRQPEWSEYSIPGQKRMFKERGLPEKQEGWYLVPGKVDPQLYYLLAFFGLTLAFLIGLQTWL
jgi:solute:Na+ symporter, SSS family